MTQAGEAQDAAPGTTAHRPAVRVHLGELVRRSGKSAAEVAEAVGIHPTNLSRLSNAHVSFIRLDTLLALCLELDCQPGDLLTVE
jgi:putative transcriptional regulator